MVRPWFYSLHCGPYITNTNTTAQQQTLIMDEGAAVSTSSTAPAEGAESIGCSHYKRRSKFVVSFPKLWSWSDFCIPHDWSSSCAHIHQLSRYWRQLIITLLVQSLSFPFFQTLFAYLSALIIVMQLVFSFDKSIRWSPDYLTNLDPELAFV